MRQLGASNESRKLKSIRQLNLRTKSSLLIPLGPSPLRNSMRQVASCAFASPSLLILVPISPIDTTTRDRVVVMELDTCSVSDEMTGTDEFNEPKSVLCPRVLGNC